ncbi:uncharacterized protein LOC125853067 [Solanum stenotomum]|uniref:uncharacterized protein LOC125853067 n=1 Tax=Solanum stenotomum TaxID=172797 RepID=UPI0020D0FA01|nr:uncharacterized protein LOC125853067 [Solanum stenotomum]
MSNLSKLEFVALDISENNYLSWVLDAKIHLDAKGHGATITNGNTTLSQDIVKAMIFLRHHLDERLKVEYLTVNDPLELWTGLKERGFKKYFELISCLLVAEQHNTPLLKTHEARPTGTALLLEANKVEAHGQSKEDKIQIRAKIMCGRGNGRGRYNNRCRGGRHKRENNMGSQSNPSRGNHRRCGMKEHWKNECRAAEHFVRLYQDSLKRKGNKNGASSSNARVESHLSYKNDVEAGPSQKYDDNIEENLALKDDDFDDLDDITHLEVEDFFGDQN